MKLPHRYPFRFVDGVVDGKARVRLTVGAARGRAGEGWTVAWLVEAVAQAAALVLAQGKGGGEAARLVLAAVDHAELAVAPDPGATLEISVRLEKSYGTLAKVAGDVLLDGHPIGSVSLVLAAG